MVDRPHIGDKVRLKAGKEITIAAVAGSRDVLYELSEVDAYLFGEKQRARLGNDWFDKYFKVFGVVDRTDSGKWYEWLELEG